MNPDPQASSAAPHAYKSYAEIGMPDFPLPLSREGATILTCAGLPFAVMQDFDDLRLLPRWKGYRIGDNHLTLWAEKIVQALNAQREQPASGHLSTPETVKVPPRTTSESGAPQTGREAELKREIRTLRKHLRELVATTAKVIALMDSEMKLPSTPERGGRIAKLTNALAMANDSAMHFGLGQPLNKS